MATKRNPYQKQFDAVMERAFSRLLVELSNAELGHADKLHTQATTVIETYRKEYGEPDARMLKRFNEKHIQCMEKAAAIKEQLAYLAKK